MPKTLRSRLLRRARMWRRSRSSAMSRNGSSSRSASAPGHAGHPAPGDLRRHRPARTPSPRGIDRDQRRRGADPRVAARSRAWRQLRELPIEAGGQTFRLGDIATIRRGYEDPPAYHRLPRRAARRRRRRRDGRARQRRGAGRDAARRGRCVPRRPPARHRRGPDRRPAARSSTESFHEFIKSFVEALVIVLDRLLRDPWLAHRHRRGAFGADRAGDRVRHHADDGHELRPHHARRAHHRARAAGRRRDHRRSR